MPSYSMVKSPTGSGKTLVMVASVLATVAHNDRPSVHFVCAYTVQVLVQLYDAIRHLGQEGLTVAMLMSRERMCAHPQVRGAPFREASDRCKVALGRKTNQNSHAQVGPCQYYQGRLQHLDWSQGPVSTSAGSTVYAPTVLDIEDASVAKKACAYYGQSAAAHRAIKAGDSAVVCGTMKLLTDMGMMQTRLVS
jgi:Rad3-related DNA helicase